MSILKVLEMLKSFLFRECRVESSDLSCHGMGGSLEHVKRVQQEFGKEKKLLGKKIGSEPAAVNASCEAQHMD